MRFRELNHVDVDRGRQRIDALAEQAHNTGTDRESVKDVLDGYPGCAYCAYPREKHGPSWSHRWSPVGDTDWWRQAKEQAA